MDGISLASFILASYPDKGITPMKLQKLAYYAKVWTLVAGKPFITAMFHKWEYGPVNTEIYHEFKHYKSAVIESFPEPSLFIEDEQAELLKFILDNYVSYSAASLSTMTHNESPWIDTPENSTIKDEAIIEFYSSKPFAKNFKHDISQNGTFHLLQSNSWHSFTLDMDPEEAASFESYDSYEAFQQQTQEAENDFNALVEKIFS